MVDENKADDPKVQAENQSVAIGGLSIGGDVSGEVNIASGHIIHAERGATVIIGASGEAVGGLIALRELMQHSSDVRTAVIAFQTDFEVAHEQVGLLGDYKDIHDLLHQLQLYCYNSIVEAAKRFPDDEMSIDNLTRYEADLERIRDGLQDVAGRPKIPKQELTWIADVNLARDNLHSAIDSLDKDSLQKVIWRLNRLLALQPARIDTLLNLAARTLRLPALLSALTNVCDHMSSLELDPDKVLAFQSGLAALSELEHALSELVDNHNHWQWMDVELRRVGASIDRDLVELEMSWPDLKLKAEQLYGSNTEEWAEALRKEENALNTALVSNYPQKKVLHYFQGYQRRATNRFFRVDSQLKSLCGDLRQIGVPLASVLRMAQ
jgi:hypothetical protein